MRRFLFLMTHLGQDGKIKNLLESNPIFQFFTSSEDLVYDHYESFNFLNVQRHKISNASAYYCEEITKNYKFHKKMLLPNYKFVFYVGEPRSTISNLCTQMDEESAIRYYTFRLQGIYEYIIRSEGFLCTWENLRLEELSLYLETPVKNKELADQPISQSASYSVMKKASVAYDNFNRFFFVT